MNLAFRPMTPDDVPATFDVRLSTVENAITMERLESDYGVTPERMAEAMTPDPALRACGFYRSLGWRGTGKIVRGDEVMVLRKDKS